MEVVDCSSEIGSGALPAQTLPSRGLALRPAGPRVRGRTLEHLTEAFRRLPAPVVGRIHQGALLFDCRCLDDADQFISQLGALDIGRAYARHTPAERTPVEAPAERTIGEAPAERTIGEAPAQRTIGEAPAEPKPVEAPGRSAS